MTPEQYKVPVTEVLDWQLPHATQTLRQALINKAGLHFGLMIDGLDGITSLYHEVEYVITFDNTGTEPEFILTTKQK